MYSPKISENYIPELYRIAKTLTDKTGKKVYMTTLLNNLVKEFLDKTKVQELQNG